MHLVNACELNFTYVFKMPHESVCVKTEVNGVVGGKTEMEKKEKVVSTMQKNIERAVERDSEERGF